MRNGLLAALLFLFVCLEDLMAKVDSLRQENRSSDKKRREVGLTGFGE